MRIRLQFAAALLLSIIGQRVALAACAVERAPVKTVTDAHASLVRELPLPATIESLHAIPPPRPLPHDGRVGPVETTVYSLTATLIAYRLTPQSEIQLVLSDEARRTIVAMIPSPECAAGSRFRPEIERARAEFERRYFPTTEFTEARRAVEVQGIGFFDYLQGQRGLAPNGLSLHPLLSIDFTPSFHPKPPAAPGRRRAVGIGAGRGCARPTLNITASRSSICANEPVTIAWQSSDSTSRVTIDGIGTSLPASGNRSVTASSSAIYSGRAANACGTSDEALTVVTLAPAPIAALSGPSSLNTGSSTSLTIDVSHAASWTLTSSLGNSINPSTGTGSRTVTYSATRSGTDTVTLRTTGGCGNVTRTLVIQIGEPPQTGGLRCCDGTRSPTCFSCSNKRGCCSGHGGVCGCP